MTEQQRLDLIRIRNYFGEPDKTGFEHWAFKILDDIVKPKEYQEDLVKKYINEPDYEYEIFFDSDPDEVIQIHGWFPIANERIRHPEKIEHYIEIGLLRRI